MLESYIQEVGLIMSLKVNAISSGDSTKNNGQTSKFLETLINLSPDILYIFDLNEHKNIYSNNGIQKVLGYSVEEIRNMGSQLMQILIHPEDFRIYTERTFLRYAELGDGERLVHQYRMKHKDGSWHYLEANEVIYARNRDQSPSQIFGVTHDITRRMQMYDELKNAKEYIENIITTANTMVVGSDIEGNITIFNDTASKITGYTKNDLEGRNWFEVLVSQERYPELWKEFRRLTSEGMPFKIENHILTKAGEERYIVWKNSVVYEHNTPVGTISFGLDITERRQAEEAIREANQFKQNVITCVREGIIVFGMDLSYKIWNPFMEELSGIKASDVLGKKPWELFPALKDAGIVDLLKAALKGECPPSVEFKFMGNKKTSWLVDTSVPLRSTQGEIIGVITSVQDITDRKDVEEKLKNSEERYRTLFRKMLDGFALHEIIYDERNNPNNYRFIDVNPSFEQMTGIKREDIIGKTVLEIMPDIEESWIKKYGKVVLTGEPVFFQSYDATIGKYFEVNAFKPAPDQVASIFTDITQRKKTEELLNNTQKLESLSVLAGGIAHDFNNLLGGIFGYIDLANDNTTDENVTSYLVKSLQTIERARSLTRQLLTFAKGGEPIKKVDKLFPFIQETAQFALCGSEVSINFNIAEDLWQCNFDKNQIGQVIDNIIINAQQAMPVGGTITLIANNVSLKEKEHPLLEEGDYCQISIKDCGIGIQREFLTKIFDPFFSTKTKGHGLGLATCYSIINRHGGCIDVESEQGKGTTFYLFLPAADKALINSSQQTSEKHLGCGTFLVMDDEEVIQETIAEMLTSFGYTVIVKGDGSEAVDFFSEKKT